MGANPTQKGGNPAAPRWRGAGCTIYPHFSLSAHLESSIKNFLEFDFFPIYLPYYSFQKTKEKKKKSPKAYNAPWTLI